MHPLTPLLLIDLVREREREIRESALRARATSGRPSVVRRGVARAFAVLSLVSASAVRRLDDCLADDLVDALAAGRGV
jgi:hypothetical protein